MNQQLATRTLQFVQISSAFAKRAYDEIEVHRGQQKRAADLRPELLTYMVESGVIDQGSKEAAEAMLGSHAETMQLLKSAVDKIVELRKDNAVKAAADFGEAEGTGGSSAPTEGYDSLNSPVVGGRPSAHVTKIASDDVLRRIMHSPT